MATRCFLAVACACLCALRLRSTVFITGRTPDQATPDEAATGAAKFERFRASRGTLTNLGTTEGMASTSWLMHGFSIGVALGLTVGIAFSPSAARAKDTDLEKLAQDAEALAASISIPNLQALEQEATTLAEKAGVAQAPPVTPAVEAPLAQSAPAPAAPSVQAAPPAPPAPEAKVPAQPESPALSLPGLPAVSLPSFSVPEFSAPVLSVPASSQPRAGPSPDPLGIATGAALSLGTPALVVSSIVSKRIAEKQKEEALRRAREAESLPVGQLLAGAAALGAAAVVASSALK